MLVVVPQMFVSLAPKFADFAAGAGFLATFVFHDVTDCALCAEFVGEGWRSSVY
jgi:hypothetical protein